MINGVSRRRAIVAAMLGVALLGLGIGVAPPASAQTLGTVTILPAKGNDGSTITAVTSGPCPKPATNVLATMYGKGFGAAGQNVLGNSPITTYQHRPNGGIEIALQYTFGDTANLEKQPVRLSGTYKIVVICRGIIRPKNVGEYVGSVTFAPRRSANGFLRYVAHNPPVPSSPTAVASTGAGTPSGSQGGSSSDAATSSPTAIASGPTPTLSALPVPGSTAGGAVAASGGSGNSSSKRSGVIVAGLGLLVVLGGCASLLWSRRSSGTSRHGT